MAEIETDSPLKDQLSSTLNSFSETVETLFHAAVERPSFAQAAPPTSAAALDTPRRRDSDAPEVGGRSAVLLHELAALDRHLAGLVQLSIRHHENQRHINELIHSIKAYDIDWKADIVSLHDADNRLGRILLCGKQDIETMENVQKENIKVEQVLGLGRRLASFSSAPPSYPERSTGLNGHIPFDIASIPNQLRHSLPFPSEDIMRRGISAIEESQTVLEDAPLGQVKQMDAQGIPENVVQPREERENGHFASTSAASYPSHPREQLNGTEDPFDLDL